MLSTMPGIKEVLSVLALLESLPPVPFILFPPAS